MGMVIDQNQDQKYFNISLDVTFPNAPCSVLNANLIDTKKSNIMHASTHLYMVRIKGGKPLGRRIRQSLVNTAMNAAELQAAGDTLSSVRTSHATAHLRCQSCFGAHADEDDCCSSCEEVREEFRKKGWNDQPSDYVFGQCIEDTYVDMPPEEQEGCIVQGNLRVQKIPGTLHIGVSKHFKSQHLKSDDWHTFVSSLDFSHEIKSLAFGPDFPGLVPVLDGRKKTQHTSARSEHYQYDVHVVPTRYLEDGYDEITSHQYSVTEYVKSVNGKAQDAPPLGFWMSYDFTPFEVRVTKSRKSMWHFLTECCAILGGIFAFTGMIDHFAYQFRKSVGPRSTGPGSVQLAQMG